jgi:hypothetical protein
MRWPRLTGLTDSGVKLRIRAAALSGCRAPMEGVLHDEQDGPRAGRDVAGMKDQTESSADPRLRRGAPAEEAGWAGIQ